MVEIEKMAQAREKVTARLLDQYQDGSWKGKLSSSALATSVACFALLEHSPDMHKKAVKAGLKWLTDNQNEDGGWGDTPQNRSNLSSTLLGWSALKAGSVQEFSSHETAASRWVTIRLGSDEPEAIANGVKARYGKDRTFATPVLSVCALAGLLGDEKKAWHFVPPLPFELVALPFPVLRVARLHVVSYALPALIGLGILCHTRQQRRYVFLSRMLRNLMIPVALRSLARMQPSNGGFLEAAPLTGFVVSGLCAAGYPNSPVVEKALDFLLNSQRKDGSWPVDSDLRTWVTSLAGISLAEGDGTGIAISSQQRDDIIQWLVNARISKPDPMTRQSGGWSWTDLPGKVPDADDTSGALIALKGLGARGPEVREAVKSGIKRLIAMQNKDGGVPTFCRGWSGMPFDRSCPEITAHAMRAIWVWAAEFDADTGRPTRKFLPRAADYLCDVQKPDGAWDPLWFGNEAVPGQRNLVFGTARVLWALSAGKDRPEALNSSMQRARRFLIAQQNKDGGWGGYRGIASTIEETSVVLTALVKCGSYQALERGTKWLVDKVLSMDEDLPAAPIGLYFASLWYSESLYPLVFAAQSLRALQEMQCR